MGVEKKESSITPFRFFLFCLGLISFLIGAKYLFFYQLHRDKTPEVNLKIMSVMGSMVPMAARINAIKWGLDGNIKSNEDYIANLNFLANKGFPAREHLKTLEEKNWKVKHE